MKPFYWIQTTLGLVGSVAIFSVLGVFPALSFLAGSALVLFNLALFQWVVSSLLSRKLIALGLFIIVSKYLILGAILYYLLSLEFLSVVWFSAGLTTLVASSLIYGSILPKLGDSQLG